MGPVLVLNQFSPLERMPENLMGPVVLRTVTVPFTFSRVAGPVVLSTVVVPLMFLKSIGPVLLATLMFPSHCSMVILATEDSIHDVPFIPATATSPMLVEMSRSASAGTDTAMSALGPPERKYLCHLRG